jgi:hypothetical protein
MDISIMKAIFHDFYFASFGAGLMAYSLRNNNNKVLGEWLSTSITMLIGFTIYHSTKHYFTG